MYMSVCSWQNQIHNIVISQDLKSKEVVSGSLSPLVIIDPIEYMRVDLPYLCICTAP